MPARMQRWIGCGISVVAVALIVLAGCKKNEESATNIDPPKPVVQVEKKKDNQGKTISARPVGLTKGYLPTFQKAVITANEVPEGEMQPPDATHTGKNAVKIFESIANDLWDKVTFKSPDGKRIRYQAIITTELGDIRVDLLGDAAPNHVRSFICLAKTGYYDGMSFYYSINRKIVDNPIAYIETGCPRGTGELGSGSIGYWLRPEISEKLTHEAGIVGACLSVDANSAACRFYITAAAMPQMDGQFTIFGKVSQGLDVVRTINKREVLENDRPKQPVVIKSVTISTIID